MNSITHLALITKTTTNLHQSGSLSKSSLGHYYFNNYVVRSTINVNGFQQNHKNTSYVHAIMWWVLYAMYFRKKPENVLVLEQPLSFKIILEFDVYTVDQKYAGACEDILLDKNAKPTFLIVEHESECRRFKRYIAVPFETVNIELDMEIISICWTKKKLDQSPDFFF